MENDQHVGEDHRRILQCASCDATVVADATDAHQRDVDTVCALCGMTMTGSAPEGADYFDVVMRAGRGRARLRRTGWSAAQNPCFDLVQRPVLRRVDDANARAVQSIEKSVRAKFAVDFVDGKPSRRHPVQRSFEIGRPDTPFRTVLKLDNVALVMCLDAHSAPFALQRNRAHLAGKKGGIGTRVGHFGGTNERVARVCALKSAKRETGSDALLRGGYAVGSVGSLAMAEEIFGRWPTNNEQISLAGLARNAQRIPRSLSRLWRFFKMATGTVKWFNPTKGYGFIQPQDGGKDVFVHISAVERAGLSSLNEGQQVEYEIVSNRGKSSAENLKVKWPRSGALRGADRMANTLKRVSTNDDLSTAEGWYLTVRCNNLACARLIAFQKAVPCDNRSNLRLAITGEPSVDCPYCGTRVRFSIRQIERRKVMLS
jgi:CspA family cold shock protein